MMTLTRGTMVGQYEILSLTGSGGMGVVYRAQDTRLKRTVALKFLAPELTRDETAKQRFLQEAQAASALDHPNICTIYEVDETPDGRLYLAMAYYEGETVKRKIERGPMPIDESLDIATQVAQGLSEAHSARIVHRDVKPANLLIAKGGVVKILDFGLAKLAGSDGITQTGTTLGTVAYMSPEQLRGQEVDQRSDIWSLGVVLFEMIAGQRPFKGDQLEIVSIDVLQGQPPSLKALRAGISPEIERVITRALAKSRNDRYQTVNDLLFELGAAKRTRDNAPRPASQPNVPSIAVLPFSNMSADAEQEYFCDGITEEIINALTRVKGLRIVARTSAFAFKGKPLDVRGIGDQLNVRYLLEGSVRKAGGRLRITAQLIGVSDGYHLWSERFDRSLDDVFAIQDEIALAIVDKLKVELFGTEREALVKRPTDRIDLYNLYLLGRYHWNHFTEEDAKKCQDYFEQALALDPTYAPAHAGMAMLYLQLGEGGVHVIPANVAVPKATAAAQEALTSDPANGEAHRALALCAIFHQHDWLAALFHCKQAFELEPHVAMNHQAYAFYLSAAGRHEEALSEIERAAVLDPVSFLVFENAAWHCYLARDFKKAREHCERSLVLNPAFGWTHLVAGLLHCQNRRLDDAISAFETARVPGLADAYLGFACGASGKRERAQEILRELERRRRGGSVSAYYFALVHLGLGENDLALTWLEAADTERPAETVVTAWLKPDPIWDPLRDDPRFQELVRRMNF